MRMEEDQNERYLCEGLISPEELSQNFRLAVATLADWRSQGKGPPYLKIGRRVWYPRDRVLMWLREQIREGEVSNHGVKDSRGAVPLPLPVRRKGVQRQHPLGRHRT